MLDNLLFKKRALTFFKSNVYLDQVRSVTNGPESAIIRSSDECMVYGERFYECYLNANFLSEPEEKTLLACSTLRAK